MNLDELMEELGRLRGIWGGDIRVGARVREVERTETVIVRKDKYGGEEEVDRRDDGAEEHAWDGEATTVVIGGENGRRFVVVE